MNLMRIFTVFICLGAVQSPLLFTMEQEVPMSQQELLNAICSIRREDIDQMLRGEKPQSLQMNTDSKPMVEKQWWVQRFKLYDKCAYLIFLYQYLIIKISYKWAIPLVRKILNKHD